MAYFTPALGTMLGIRASSDFELAQQVQAGLPLHSYESLKQLGLTKKELESLILPARSLTHRQERANRLGVQTFSEDESERIVRIAHIVLCAEQTFENREQALAWMRAPKHRLEGQTPLAVSRTAAGARLVETILLQAQHGMVA